ncbi:hypothetical protein PHLCEN_2v7081 [Hermanssonia centrifuga]|uniref:Uncharacterized protein n=1 Tax=Hermanssonia centrifuga TaxID=98765 RepID=A0A2R6NXL9_9APHY|nr:hypothetical protein PHLCEN_2v7081 [Hermanssonia centrifuga]
MEMKAARIKRNEDREDAVLHTQHSSELMQDIDPEPPPPEIDPDMGQINLSFEGMEALKTVYNQFIKSKE